MTFHYSSGGQILSKAFKATHYLAELPTLPASSGTLPSLSLDFSYTTLSSSVAPSLLPLQVLCTYSVPSQPLLFAQPKTTVCSVQNNHPSSGKPSPLPHVYTSCHLSIIQLDNQLFIYGLIYSSLPDGKICEVRTP